MDVSTQGWDKTFEAMNKEGRLDQKIMGKVLQALCETVDEIEEKGKADEKAAPVQSS